MFPIWSQFAFHFVQRQHTAEGGATSLRSTTSGVQVCAVRIWCPSQPCYTFWTIILSSEACPALEWPVRNPHLVGTCRLSWHFNMWAFPDLDGKEGRWFPLPCSLGLKTSDLAKTGRETSAQERSLLIVPSVPPILHPKCFAKCLRESNECLLFKKEKFNSTMKNYRNKEVRKIDEV